MDVNGEATDMQDTTSNNNNNTQQNNGHSNSNITNKKQRRSSQSRRKKNNNRSGGNSSSGNQGKSIDADSSSTNNSKHDGSNNNKRNKQTSTQNFSNNHENKRLEVERQIDRLTLEPERNQDQRKDGEKTQHPNINNSSDNKNTRINDKHPANQQFDAQEQPKNQVKTISNNLKKKNRNRNRKKNNNNGDNATDIGNQHKDDTKDKVGVAVKSAKATNNCSQLSALAVPYPPPTQSSSAVATVAEALVEVALASSTVPSSNKAQQKRQSGKQQHKKGGVKTHDQQQQRRKGKSLNESNSIQNNLKQQEQHKQNQHNNRHEQGNKNHNINNNRHETNDAHTTMDPNKQKKQHGKRISKKKKQLTQQEEQLANTSDNTATTQKLQQLPPPSWEDPTPLPQPEEVQKQLHVVSKNPSFTNSNNGKQTLTNTKRSKGNSSHSNTISAKPTIPPSQPQTTNPLSYKQNQPITLLHIAEKPSIATAIAAGLNKGGESDSERGRGLPVHQFTTNQPFAKAPYASVVHHVVTSVAGHVYSLDFPPQYQSWESVDPAELFFATTVKKANKGSVVKHLADCAKGVDFLVLWMDCDREGENINFEVLDICLHLLTPSSDCSNYDRVYRAQFSAINSSDIVKAYSQLGKPDKNQSLSVDARQELDLKVGVAFSRFQTRYFQGRYGDLDSAVLSYGPCQTPTLGFTVQRHLDIQTFVREPYWTLDLGVIKATSSTGGNVEAQRVCRAVWEGGRSFHPNKIVSLRDLVCESKDVGDRAVWVEKVVTKDKKQGRPTPLNTVALLKACSKSLGIGPHATMQTAERLYLSGYLSYPRTESTAYPTSFDILGTLRQQSNDARWGKYVRSLIANNEITKSRGGVDMGDHPPITPCREVGGYELSGDMARVYDLVVRHFIASVSQDAVWKSTRVYLKIDVLKEKGRFVVSGRELVSKGFLEVVLYKQYEEESSRENNENEDLSDEEIRPLPKFVEGEIIPILVQSSEKKSEVSKVAVLSSQTFLASSRATLGIKEGMTSPPSYLTESELISKMEHYGIGTDASIATHIENILKRNYAEMIPGGGRRIKPSKLGLTLAQGYHLIDSGLVLPKIRADIENQCDLIAKGLAFKEDVIRKALDLFSDKYEYFTKNIDKMDVLFGSSFARLADVGKAFTRCGLTRRYLMYIQGPPTRLYNKFTETVYPLPAGGITKQWTGRKCPVENCSFEMCLYTCGDPGRTFPLCPSCYNNPRPEWNNFPFGATDINKDAIDRADENKELQISRLSERKGAHHSLVLECPLPDKHPTICDLTVSPDPESGGVFILDVTSSGQKWRLVSTRDPTIIHFPKIVEKVTVLDKVDDITGCHYMQVDFRTDASANLPQELNGETSHVSCFPADIVMQNLITVFRGSERLKAGKSGGRGRGRSGRGGRGRGRGRWD